MTSVNNTEEMITFGRKLGKGFRGGEVLELIGDVGAGKTTLVKGIGEGMQVQDDVQSPSFTISRVYEARDGLSLHHYDFYRLSDAGVLSYELAESVSEPDAVTVIEWADTVADVLPENRVTIRIAYDKDGAGRQLRMRCPKAYDYLEAN